MVGQRADKLVVIPASMENIDRHTYDMLKKYLSSAGKVLCFRPQVIRVDGAESDEIAHLQKNIRINGL